MLTSLLTIQIHPHSSVSMQRPVALVQLHAKVSQSKVHDSREVIDIFECQLHPDDIPVQTLQETDSSKGGKVAKTDE